MIALVAWIGAVVVRLIVFTLQHRVVHIAFLADRPKQSSFNPLSIVVIFKEANPRLDALIENIIRQDYSGSWTLYLVHDNAEEPLAAGAKWLERDPRIRCMQHAKHTAGKKGALAEVMQSIQTDWVLFTDMDCMPRSDQWVSAMMGASSLEIDMVLGVSPFEEKIPDSWMHYDTLTIFLSYIYWAKQGRPYMSVGRNVLVHKSWWEEAGGVSHHLDKAGGDDDLTIQKAHRRPRTACSVHKNAHTLSAAPESLQIYLKSKARHLSAGMSYSPVDRLLLTALSGAQAVLVIGCFALLWFYPIPIIVIALLYFLIVHSIISRWMNALEIKWSLIKTLRAEMITPVLYAYIVVQALGRNEKTW